jgi:formylglycine-generating enzyme required for sulfatase activity/predicted Ser/Thr protein kinase
MDNHTLPFNFPLNNKYRIKKVLGQGGFGITYLAADTQLDIDVCIKELFISGNSTRGQNMTVLTQNLKEFSFNDFKERFIQEAKQLARFSNPGIVRVIEFFEANNTAYLVMEYVPGKNLKDYIAENGPMKETEALPLIHQLFDAVEEVHNVGMLHRDLKPDNILLTAKNRVVLIDFGAAREFTEGKTITQTAMLTPGFAPIEQYSNRAKRGTFTDIYALGATLYFLLTGHKPIAATDRYREQLAAPHQINPAVSEQLSSAVMMAMEMKEEDRFQHIGDFRAAMTMLAKGKQENPVKEEKEQKTLLLKKEEEKQKPVRKKEINLVLIISAIALALIVVELFITKPWEGSVAPLSPNSEYFYEVVDVAGGTFTMGCTSEQSDCGDNEKPPHQVTLSSYKIGKYEVTQAQWKAVMGSNPSHFNGYFNTCENCPVENVSWNDVQEFIQGLEAKSGKKYRLPTEAEWEFAARGGNNSNKSKYSGSNILDEVAWYDGTSGSKIHSVGGKKPNELGIYDMSGNVWEWCSDWYGEYNTQAQNNPTGPANGSLRVLRGGGCFSLPQFCRVSFRYYYNPDVRNDGIGFRLVLVPSS